MQLQTVIINTGKYTGKIGFVSIPENINVEYLKDKNFIVEFTDGSKFTFTKDEVLFIIKNNNTIEINKKEGFYAYEIYGTFFDCPSCDNEVYYKSNYCSKCGKKIIWLLKEK